MMSGTKILTREGFRSSPPVLYLIAGTEGFALDRLVRSVEAAIRGGVGMVQAREKSPSRAHRVATASALRRLTERSGVPLIVNDDPVLAVEVGADGVHVGQDDMPWQEARRIIGDDRLLGLSTHTRAEIAAANDGDLDMIGFGPVFVTRTKDAGAPRGVDDAASALRCSTLPTYLIGGIDADGVRLLAAVGARHVAVARAILHADDPEAAASEIRAALTASEERATPSA